MACPSRDDLVAYALGALEPDEERAVEAHAPGCERCTRELEALAPAVAVLGESVEQLEPPARAARAAAGDGPRGGRRARSAAAATLPRPARHPRASSCAPPPGSPPSRSPAPGVAGYLVHDEGGGGGPSTVPVTAQTGIGGSLAVGGHLRDAHRPRHAAAPEGAVYQVWVAEDSKVRPVLQLHPRAQRQRDRPRWTASSARATR